MIRKEVSFFGRGDIEQLFPQYLLDQLTHDLVEIGSRHKQIIFANSLSMEDLLIFHVLNHQAKSVAANYRVITLNTGRLPEQSLVFIEQIQAQYPIQIESYSPEENVVNAYVDRYGEDGFYASFEARKACCDVRKTQVLSSVLSNNLESTTKVQAWVTGQRQQQSITRTELPWFEQDQHYQLDKYNPLYLWSFDQIQSVSKALNIPYHPFYDQGYRSIGCAPCTRAVEEGAHERSGRWWWESPEQKECGIHWVNGKIQRTKA